MKTRPISGRRQSPQRGQAMVESALVLIVTMGLILGTCDFGQFLYLHQSLTERARAAARYGAVNSYTWPGTDIQNMAVYNTTSPAQNASSLVPGLTTGM